MQELLHFLLDQFWELCPLFRVEEWELGMLVRGGKILRELAPGIHWKVPYLDEIKTHTSAEVVIDLATAAVETSDGIPFAVSANIAYCMESIAANYRAVWDGEESLQRLALGRIASYLAEKDAAHLRADRGALERRLRTDLNRSVKDWGLNVTRVHLTDCVRIRAHRHYVDGIGHVPVA